MIKVLDGPESAYVPFKRSVNWLKLKKDYMEGLTDSVDLVSNPHMHLYIHTRRHLHP